MTDPLSLIPTAVLAYFLWRADRQHDEAERAWRLERVGLLNRIQGATYEPPEPEPSGAALYIAPDDDEAYNEYVEQRETGEVA